MALRVAIADGGLDGSTFELMIVVDVLLNTPGFEQIRLFHQRARQCRSSRFSGYAFSNFETPDADDEKHRHDRDERSPGTSSFRREHAAYSRR